MKHRVVSNKLARQLVDSSFSADQIDKWVEAVSAEIGGVSWRHVGWTPSRPDVNNAGTCEVANDKRAPIAEDIFNAEDAVIELARVLKGFKDPSSPHSAVASCDIFASDDWKFGKIFATLQKSGVDTRPTLDIRDLGCGQHPDGWIDTFLSLHSGTKSDKSYLCGKFGMGLKSSFKFCPRLVLVSRCHEATLGGRSDEIGVTVVRKSYTKGDKTPRYEYLCDADGEIIRLDLPSFQNGTLVRLSEYDLDGYHGRLTTPNNSLYILLNSYLIDPPVSLTIQDRRRRVPESRKFRGLLHNLENPKVANSHEERFAVNVDFEGEQSSIKVRYYVLHPKASLRDKSGTKVKAEQGVTFSHNGQRHGVESRMIFKTRFGLGAIYTRLAVLVDTSGLQPAACSDLFSSNRIGVNSDSKVYGAIMEAIGAHIRGDEELQALDEEANSQKSEKNAALTESLEKTVSDLVVDILGKRRIAFKKKGSIGVAKGGGGRPRRNRDDSHLPVIPTRVLIDNKPFVAPQGRFAYLTLDIDAKNLYVVPGDGKVSVKFNTAAKVTSQGELIGGKLRLTVTVPDSTPKGDSPFQVLLEDPANGVRLTADGTLRVVDPKGGKSGKGNKKSEGDGDDRGGPNVFLTWLFHEDWNGTDDDKWNETHPGDCHISRPDGAIHSIAFRLNADFAPIAAIRARMIKRKSKAYEDRLVEYATTLCAALLYEQLQGMSPEASFSTAILDSVFDGINLEDDDVDHDDDKAEDKEVKASRGHKIPAPRRGLIGHATFIEEAAAAIAHRT